MPRNSARYALKFVRRAVMNVPNTKWSIVSDALWPVISALMNCGKWQRNNTRPPLPMTTTAQQVGLSEPSVVCGCHGDYGLFGVNLRIRATIPVITQAVIKKATVATISIGFLARNDEGCERKK